MFEGAVAAIAGLFTLVGVSWLLSEIRNRVPSRKTERLPEPFGCKRFSANVDLEQFWVNEIKVAFVDDWECGIELSATGNGPISFQTHKESSKEANDFESLSNHELAELEAREGLNRAYFTLYPDGDALSGTSRIGWCKLNESHEKFGKYAEIHIGLPRDFLATILAELRIGSAKRLSAGGFENEAGKIVITSFAVSER